MVSIGADTIATAHPADHTKCRKFPIFTFPACMAAAAGKGRLEAHVGFVLNQTIDENSSIINIYH
jgi:hypothetical protein